MEFHKRKEKDAKIRKKWKVIRVKFLMESPHFTYYETTEEAYERYIFGEDYGITLKKGSLFVGWSARNGRLERNPRWYTELHAKAYRILAERNQVRIMMNPEGYPLSDFFARYVQALCASKGIPIAIGDSLNLYVGNKYEKETREITQMICSELEMKVEFVPVKAGWYIVQEG
jgi:hypothetical protein